MRWPTFFVIVFACTLLEAGNLLTVFSTGGWYIRPSLLITVLVYYALSTRTRQAIVCSFLIGFAADLAAGLIGPHTVCCGGLGLLLNQVRQLLTVRQALYRAGIIFAVYLTAETFTLWLGMLKVRQTIPYSTVLLTGLYSAVISPLLWSFLSILNRGAGTRESLSGLNE
ncbi:MAG TPA: rod shape-determining protein MreD [Anaerohalosphaeraceae bacterium]|nr:rod shape-determining protein MreD [Phycisphaerae bacterium]HOK96659.1 rod shape-determining protein MreD [Anaerohalosphaeraceae bacterium]HOL31813.1 rod shape-determining protein MreD [Anaerohalosphaeraceae bacterium]HOM75481.1 rod shape-determining protein MreD [Anaerohalosphaeraceae bacterium]HPC63791.1 rod shape-determining protein MreD [Anaerohalosphaeraceae bacterium]